MKGVCLELTRASSVMGTGWFARWYQEGALNQRQFLNYSKKEVIQKLRDRNVSVSNDVIKYGYK